MHPKSLFWRAYREFVVLFILRVPAPNSIGGMDHS
jgi:hypothetical protein